MQTFDKSWKYQYSIVHTCEILHGHIVGSQDGVPLERLKELFHWLYWRVTECWDVSGKKYDSIVLQLAAETISLAIVYFEEVQEV